MQLGNASRRRRACAQIVASEVSVWAELSMMVASCAWMTGPTLNAVLFGFLDGFRYLDLEVLVIDGGVLLLQLLEGSFFGVLDVFVVPLLRVFVERTAAWLVAEVVVVLDVF